MRELTQPRHPALFEGDREFADSPALVNTELYFGAHEWGVFLDTNTPAGKPIKVSASQNPQFASGGSRVIAAVLFEGEDFRLLMPWYRSSGMATPERSPKGLWWPTSGLYTQAYCRLRGHSDSIVGYIGKHYQGMDGAWYPHNKERENLPLFLRQVQQAFVEACEGRIRA